MGAAFSKAAAVLLSCFAAAAACAQTTPTLVGPRVVKFAPADVAFVRSQLEVRQGKRLPESGACSYASDLKVAPGDLMPGEKLVRVQRAHDPDTCRELVETGVVRQDLPVAEPMLRGSGRLSFGPASSGPAVKETLGRQKLP